MGTRDRISRLEKALTPKNKPGMLLVMAVPDDWPEPVPPGYVRERDLDKIDRRGYSSVLVLVVPPPEDEVEAYKAQLQAEQQAQTHAPACRGRGRQKKNE